MSDIAMYMMAVVAVVAYCYVICAAWRLARGIWLRARHSWRSWLTE